MVSNSHSFAVEGWAIPLSRQGLYNVLYCLPCSGERAPQSAFVLLGQLLSIDPHKRPCAADVLSSRFVSPCLGY